MRLSRVLTAAIVLITALSSCNTEEPETIDCITAELRLCNHSKATHIIKAYYTNNGRWEDYVEFSIPDTVRPGECRSYPVDGYVVDHSYNGYNNRNAEVRMFTVNDEGLYLFNDCFTAMTFESGLLNFDGNLNYCENGQFDPIEGELDTDCGGYCLPCDPFDFPCEPAKDEFNVQTLLHSRDAIDSYTIIGGNYINFEITMADWSELDVMLYVTEIPNATRKFIIGTQPHQARLEYRRTSSTWRAEEGQEIYVIKGQDGNLRLKFCDVQFTYDGFTYPANCNVSLNN